MYLAFSIAAGIVLAYLALRYWRWLLLAALVAAGLCLAAGLLVLLINLCWSHSHIVQGIAFGLLAAVALGLLHAVGALFSPRASGTAK